MSWINPASTSCVAATYRRCPLNAFLDPQSLEGRTKIVASHGDESDPWPRAECWRVPRDAFVPGDQKYRHGGNVEQERVDVEPAASTRRSGPGDVAVRATHVVRSTPDATRRRNAVRWTLPAPARTASAATRERPS